ncbi:MULTISPECIES: VOC family protein [Ensifer]|uniref:VOC family protein n=1 Tax=Ensifer TaxID=106591 RepID=UPI001AEE3D6D|nr:VOC family protein [Ensifer adhaerens]
MCNTEGPTYNFCVADVDGEYSRIRAAGLAPALPIEDHPWGDRGFAVKDPNGVLLYIYSNREPAPEFKPFVIASGAA